MRKCAIFLVCDNELVFALGNILLQLNKYNFFNRIIIEHNISDSNVINLLSRIDKRCFFVNRNPNDVISKLKFDVKNNLYMNIYGAKTFYKFFAFDYLNEFDNLIILDIDMLFQSDFSEILSDAPIAYKPRGYLCQYINNIKPNFTIPNCGLIALNKYI